MSGVMQFYNYILFWLYQSLSEQHSTSAFWLLTLVIVAGFAFTIFYMRYLIVRPVKAMCDTLVNINQQEANLAANLPQFSFDEFKELSTQYNLFTNHLSDLLSTTHASAKASEQSNVDVNTAMQNTQQLSEQQTHKLS